MAKIEDLIGKTLTEVTQASDEIRFLTADGERYVMHHRQDCCESVEIESITGELDSLIGNPILVAEESVSDENPHGVERSKHCSESQTWTFYKLATIKGHVDIRWYGSSNGYYSESVDFDEIRDD